MRAAVLTRRVYATTRRYARECCDWRVAERSGDERKSCSGLSSRPSSPSLQNLIFGTHRSDSWGPRLEHFLYHGVAALISRRHATLINLPRLYTDDRFRERVVRHVTDSETLRFWTEEFPSYTKTLRSDAIAPILNKAGQIAASPHLRLILGQVAPRLDLSFAMNNRRILIANLAKGR